jgi:hypothetical protein
MSDTRIIAVSLAVKATPLVAMATATSNALHIISIEKLPRTVSKIKERLAELKAKASEVGAELVIEDQSGLLSGFGRPLRLDGKGINGQPVLVEAMERYNALTNVGAITYPEQNKSSMTLSRSLYNIKHSDGGTVSYVIDWEQLRDEQRVMLVCLHAALCQSVFNTGFIDQMFAHAAPVRLLESDDSKPNPRVNLGNGGKVVLL